MMGRPLRIFSFFTDGRSFPSFFLFFCVSCFSRDREEFGLQHYNAPSRPAVVKGEHKTFAPPPLSPLFFVPRKIP